MRTTLRDQGTLALGGGARTGQDNVYGRGLHLLKLFFGLLTLVFLFLARMDVRYVVDALMTLELSFLGCNCFHWFGRRHRHPLCCRFCPLLHVQVWHAENINDQTVNTHSIHSQSHIL